MIGKKSRPYRTDFGKGIMATLTNWHPPLSPFDCLSGFRRGMKGDVLIEKESGVNYRIYLFFVG